jgi:hypothetical protein
MLTKPSISNVLSGTLIAADEYESILNKQAKHLENKINLLTKIEPFLGVSGEMSEIINNIFDVISTGDDLLKLIPEYFELVSEDNIERKREFYKTHISLLKGNEELQQKLEATKVKYLNSKKATQKRYAYTGDVALEEVKKYAEEYPKRLSPSVCTRGVKADIDRKIAHRMMNQEEYVKSNLSQPPTPKTIEKYRKEAFKKLGYDQ